MRLRFTIRDLLWLTVVVALAVGWWLDRRNANLERDNWQVERTKLTSAVGEATRNWLKAQSELNHALDVVRQYTIGETERGALSNLLERANDRGK